MLCTMYTSFQLRFTILRPQLVYMCRVIFACDTIWCNLNHNKNNNHNNKYKLQQSTTTQGFHNIDMEALKEPVSQLTSFCWVTVDQLASLLMDSLNNGVDRACLEVCEFDLAWQYCTSSMTNANPDDPNEKMSPATGTMLSFFSAALPV